MTLSKDEPENILDSPWEEWGRDDYWMICASSLVQNSSPTDNPTGCMIKFEGQKIESNSIIYVSVDIDSVAISMGNEKIDSLVSATIVYDLTSEYIPWIVSAVGSSDNWAVQGGYALNTGDQKYLIEGDATVVYYHTLDKPEVDPRVFFWCNPEMHPEHIYVYDGHPSGLKKQ
jgi:hypothetical protein